MKPQRPKTIAESIIETVTDGYSSVLSKKDVGEMLEFVIAMLTEDQKEMLYKKMNICKEYKRMFDKGLSDKNIRSIISRRYNVKNYHTVWACTPCYNWMESQNK